MSRPKYSRYVAGPLCLCLMLAVVASVGASKYEEIEQDLTREIDILRTPVSPAFQMLKWTPAVIVRPQTPRAVMVSLSDAVLGEGDESLAMEFSPYWLVSHPEVTFDDFYAPSIPGAAVMNASVSVAIDRLDDSLGTEAAVGARTVLFAGKPSMSLSAVYSEYYSMTMPQKIVESLMHDVSSTTTIDELRQIVDLRCEQLLRDPGAHTGLEGSTLVAAVYDAAETINDYIDEGAQDTSATAQEIMFSTRQDVLIDLVETQRELRSAIMEAELTRQGWLLEVASAAAGRFPGNDFDGFEPTRVAGWITPGYAFDRIDMIAVLRVVAERDPDRTLYDFGGRAVVETDLISLGAEALGRDGDYESYRVALNVEAKLTDDLYASATFGKDFEESNDEDDLLSLFKVDYNLGRLPRLVFD